MKYALAGDGGNSGVCLRGRHIYKRDAGLTDENLNIVRRSRSGGTSGGRVGDGDVCTGNRVWCGVDKGKNGTGRQT